jgi:chromosome segregation ATPase
MERKLNTEMGELQASLEEKEEDSGYLKEQQGDTGREEDSKIEALEMTLGGVEDSKQLKEKLQQVEDQVWRERNHVAELEDRQIELIREKEEALDELEEARFNIVDLEKRLRDRDIRDLGINHRYAHLL